jgi:hypothetical protein
MAPRWETTDLFLDVWLALGAPTPSILDRDELDQAEREGGWKLAPRTAPGRRRSASGACTPTEPGPRRSPATGRSPAPALPSLAALHHRTTEGHHAEPSHRHPAQSPPRPDAPHPPGLPPRMRRGPARRGCNRGRRPGAAGGALRRRRLSLEGGRGCAGHHRGDLRFPVPVLRPLGPGDPAGAGQRLHPERAGADDLHQLSAPHARPGMVVGQGGALRRRPGRLLAHARRPLRGAA